VEEYNRWLSGGSGYCVPSNEPESRELKRHEMRGTVINVIFSLKE